MHVTSCFFCRHSTVSCRCPSIYWDHALHRAPVLPKQSPGLLGTIQDRSPLRGRILEWLDHPSKLVLVLSTSEGCKAESTPPGINSSAKQDLNSGSQDPKPTTLTIMLTPAKIAYIHRPNKGVRKKNMLHTWNITTHRAGTLVVVVIINRTI